jgi:hypothetical protein
MYGKNGINGIISENSKYKSPNKKNTDKFVIKIIFILYMNLYFLLFLNSIIFNTVNTNNVIKAIIEMQISIINEEPTYIVTGPSYPPIIATPCDFEKTKM